jgi:CrcB protein
MTLVGWLLVGLGGACGAAARHALALWITRAMAGGAAFPIGIFIVNVLGSAAAGTVAGLAAAGRFPSGDGLRLFVVVGLLGGFTTFSTFTVDTLALLRAGRPELAALNVVGQVLVALAATAIAWRVAS